MCIRDRVIDVLFDSDADIYGFQFAVNGVDVVQAGGGQAAESGFTVSNSATTIIGFSLQGDYIPAGEGVLVSVEVVGNASDACLYCINPLYSASPLVPSEKNIAPSFDVPERIVIPVCPDVAIVKSSAEE